MRVYQNLIIAIHSHCNQKKLIRYIAGTNTMEWSNNCLAIWQKLLNNKVFFDEMKQNMKNKCILRIGALAFAMATVFMISAQKNLSPSEVSAFAVAESGNSVVCWCKLFGGSICSSTGWGSPCATYSGSRQCEMCYANCH